MKHLILAVVVLINVGSLVAQDAKFDTLTSATWPDNSWQNFSRTINNYDADCRLKTALHQVWDVTTGKWTDHLIETYSYVNEKYISEIFTQLWSNNSWINNYRENYTYDISFKTLSIVGQTWSSNHWSNHIATINTYDNKGDVDSVLMQHSAGDDPFENTNLTIYINNNDGTLHQTINQNWNKTTLSWDNYSKYSLVYNNHKTIDTATTFLWNSTKASWQPYKQTINTYAGTGKLIYYLTRDWQTSQWINQSLYSSYYDNNGFVGNVLVEKWDGFDFEKFTQTLYKNNSDGTVYQHTDQFWDEAKNAWTNDLQETYSYPEDCLLPLKLILFTASKNNNTVNLNWQTTNEKNISHFTVQRNSNGADFTDLNDIPAQSGTGINSYAYTDNIENITGDKIFYRLKIIDSDGLYTYTKTVPIALSVNTATELKVYPNPAKDKLVVSFAMQNTSRAELRITDVSGKIVYNKIVSNQRNGITDINISSLSKGMYYVMLIIDNNSIQRARFLKQ